MCAWAVDIQQTYVILVLLSLELSSNLLLEKGHEIKVNKAGRFRWIMSEIMMKLSDRRIKIASSSLLSAVVPVFVTHLLQIWGPQSV